MSIKMAVVTAAGVFGGYQLDQWVGIKFPVFTLVFSLLSVALAIYILIRDTRS